MQPCTLASLAGLEATMPTAAELSFRRVGELLGGDRRVPVIDVDAQVCARGRVHETPVPALLTEERGATVEFAVHSTRRTKTGRWPPSSTTLRARVPRRLAQSASWRRTRPVAGGGGRRP